MITILDKPAAFIGGIQLPAHKAISLQGNIKKPFLPTIIKLPVRQHIGSPAKPVVAVGDNVMKGQIVAGAQGAMSAITHASTSGTVRAIAKHPLPNPSGSESTCIIIEPDGNDAWGQPRTSVDDYQSLEPISIQQKILDAGIIGLGGAGFPTATKLIPGLNLDIELLIINAAECEPYISCDEALLRHRIDEVILGTKILAQALQVDECVIAIEDNKTECIQLLTAAADSDISIQLVPSIYPAGGERQLIQSITGVSVPAGGLPVDVGIVCYNVSTAVAVKKAVIASEPLISRIVTVTGLGINEPGNIEVLIGTPINEIIQHCGGYNEHFERLIIGGPMMGFQLANDSAPLIKTNSCLLAADKTIHTAYSTESPCIRCDQCAPVCPMQLQPQQLYCHSKAFNSERLTDYRLFDCIECGCCAYVCPSHIPLVDHYRQAKTAIWQDQLAQLKTKKNKQRYTNKQHRLAEKQALAKPQQAATTAAAPELGLKEKQAEIAAAVGRVKQKRQTQSV